MLLGFCFRFDRWIGVPGGFGRKRIRGIEAGFRKKTLRERGKRSIRQIEFHAFDAMHREEHHGWSKRFPVANHHGEVFKGSEFDAAQAKSGRSQREDHSPEFFARI